MKPFTYRIVGGGVGTDGWWKFNALRSDGRQCRLTRKRTAQLRRENRITETATQATGNSGGEK